MKNKITSNTVSKILSAVGSSPVSVVFKSNGTGFIKFYNGKDVSFTFEKTGLSFIKANGEKTEDGLHQIKLDWNSNSVRELLTKKSPEKELVSSVKFSSRDKDLESDGVEKRRRRLTRPSRDDLKKPGQKRETPIEDRDNDIHNDDDMKLS